MTVLVAYTLILLLPFLPVRHHSGGGEPSLAGGQGAMIGGLANQPSFGWGNDTRNGLALLCVRGVAGVRREDGQ